MCQNYHHSPNISSISTDTPPDVFLFDKFGSPGHTKTWLALVFFTKMSCFAQLPIVCLEFHCYLIGRKWRNCRLKFQLNATYNQSEERAFFQLAALRSAIVGGFAQAHSLSRWYCCLLIMYYTDKHTCRQLLLRFGVFARERLHLPVSALFYDVLYLAQV
jgi:hypothetical protein